MGQRTSGILLHLTSLPGPGGIGREAYDFVDFLASAGCGIWQMLPPSPMGPGNSPYAARSAFALEPMLISIAQLADDGLLDPRTDFYPETMNRHRHEFDLVRQHREPLLRAAFREFMAGGGRVRLDQFAAANPWLAGYAAFASLRELSREAWWLWPVRYHHPEEVPAAEGSSLGDEVRYQQFLQWALDRQWHSLRDYARSRGVALYGDVPIFVDLDSADAWSNQALFKLAADGQPAVVAGVPPDAFSSTGQRWGNPHYDWDAMRENGFAWWVERMRRTFSLFDGVRIDHFRGFESAWEIPCAAETAMEGHWQQGPGRELFDALSAALGELPIVVEDLGLITPAVRELRDCLGYPGMAVLQFAFGDDETNPYLPHNQVANQVVFTGTHDNDTTLGWYRNASEWERDHVRRYLSVDGTDIVHDLVRCAYHSVADTALIPMQDVLQLGSEARMNVPGSGEGNWAWRFTWDQLPEAGAQWLSDLAHETGRHASVAVAR
ncbi:MAG: 4-alpha-glucanotransferase [bacterium]